MGQCMECLAERLEHEQAFLARLRPGRLLEVLEFDERRLPADLHEADAPPFVLNLPDEGIVGVAPDGSTTPLAPAHEQGRGEAQGTRNEEDSEPLVPTPSPLVPTPYPLAPPQEALTLDLDPDVQREDDPCP